MNFNCEGCKHLIKLKIGKYHHIKYCKFEEDNDNFFIKNDAISCNKFKKNKKDLSEETLKESEKGKKGNLSDPS